MAMYFKTFEKLDFETKVEILGKIGYLYDLTVETSEKALRREFKFIEPQIIAEMIKRGLYHE